MKVTRKRVQNLEISKEKIKKISFGNVKKVSTFADPNGGLL
jgi:CRISPR/Cas system CSM-associated protein Csm4 (group 5 of RAMP superfamily)